MKKLIIAISVLISLSSNAQKKITLGTGGTSSSGSTTTTSSSLPPGWIDAYSYGVKGDDSNDDTDSLQAIINTKWAAGYINLTIYFRNGHYLFGSAAKTTDGNGHGVNTAQIYVPLTPYTSPKGFGTLTLIGESAPNHFGNFSIPGQGLPGGANADGGVLFESSLLTSQGSVIGTAYETTTWGTFNFNKLFLKNIHIRVRSKTGTTNVAPQMTGINAANLAMCQFESLRIDTQSAPDSSVMPGSEAIGIRMPLQTNWGDMSIRDIYIQGFYTGIRTSEHTQGSDVWVHASYIGVEFASSVHASHFDRLLTTWCKTNIYISARCSFNIDQLDCENYVSNGSTVLSRWYDFVYDVSEYNGASGGTGAYGTIWFMKNHAGGNGDFGVSPTTNTTSTHIKMKVIGVD